MTGLGCVTDVAHNMNAASRFDHRKADKPCNDPSASSAQPRHSGCATHQRGRKRYPARSKVCGKTRQLQGAVSRVLQQSSNHQQEALHKESPKACCLHKLSNKRLCNQQAFAFQSSKLQWHTIQPTYLSIACARKIGKSVPSLLLLTASAPGWYFVCLSLKF